MVSRWSTVFRFKKRCSHTGTYCLYDLSLYLSCFIEKSPFQTPDPGINFDNSSVVKSTPNKDDPALGWFKTMIQRDTAMPISWPDYSQGMVLIVLILFSLKPKYSLKRTQHGVPFLLGPSTHLFAELQYLRLDYRLMEGSFF